MNFGNQISNIRREKKLTQEEFGALFHVTRQTVSNWENGKNYPDMQTLVEISNKFDISLDVLMKGDVEMINAFDKDRLLGRIRKDISRMDFFTGSGTGIVAACLISPDSARRTVAIIIGLVMIGIGWYKKAKNDKEILRLLEEVQ